MRELSGTKVLFTNVYLNNARAQWNKGTFYRCGTKVPKNNARAQWNKGTFYQRIPK